MNLPGTRRLGALLALPLLFCLLALGANQADARRCCPAQLSGVKLVNGGDLDVPVMRVDVLLGDDSASAHYLRQVGPSKSKFKNLRPHRLYNAKAVQVRLCLDTGERGRAMLRCHFPEANGSDEELLGKGSITRVVVLLGRDFSDDLVPGAQVKFELSNGKFVLRTLRIEPAGDCAAWESEDYTGSAGGQPFIRLRLRNQTDPKKKKKPTAVSATGYIMDAKGKTSNAVSHAIQSNDIPFPRHDYPAAQSLAKTVESNYVTVSITYDGTTYTGSYGDKGHTGCRIERVDFEITSKEAIKAHFYVHDAAMCSAGTTITLK